MNQVMDSHLTNIDSIQTAKLVEIFWYTRQYPSAYGLLSTEHDYDAEAPNTLG